MKKLSVVLFAAILALMFTLPALAVDSEFGGYWRTRLYSIKNFTGEDSNLDANDHEGTIIDTRTRLYYTAIFHENLKFVNKFEMDAVWGGPASGYGDIGADGISVEVKNSYADFNLGAANFKIGVQGIVLANSYLFDDDASAAVITFNGNGVTIPVYYIKHLESGLGDDRNNDADYYAVAPKFMLGEGMSVSPYLVWYSTDNMGSIAGNGDKFNLYSIGADFAATLGLATINFTAIYQTGTEEIYMTDDDIDYSAFLLALNGEVNLGQIGVHGGIYYATGDDPDTDDEVEAFMNPHSSWYWSEINGLGVFDFECPDYGAGDKLTNLLAGNLGVSMKPSDRVKLQFDLWYSKQDEAVFVVGDDEMDEYGTEIQGMLTYQLLDGLSMDVVAAYMFAGDAITHDVDDEADPWEIGTRLQLKF